MSRFLSLMTGENIQPSMPRYKSLKNKSEAFKISAQKNGGKRQNSDD